MVDMYKNETFLNFLKEEPNCSYNGEYVLVSGNTKKPSSRGTIDTKLLTVDEFMLLKGEKKVSDIRLDHGNGYVGSKDRNGNSWKQNIACKWIGPDGKQYHCFANTLLGKNKRKRNK